MTADEVEHAPNNAVTAVLADEEDVKRQRHNHLLDVGMTSLAAYFFCLFSSMSILSGGLYTDAGEWVTTVSFLVFVGSCCLMLLFLAVSQAYFEPFAGKRWFAIASGVLMAVGPLACVVDIMVGHEFSALLALLFALSGCGYAMGLLAWGRILSQEDEQRSSRQLFSDVCAASIVMVLVALVDESLGMAILTCLALCSGIVAHVLSSNLAKQTEEGQTEGEQVVVSDTRNSIPGSSYFIGGSLWMVFGISWATWSGSPLFDQPFNFATAMVLGFVALAVVGIVAMHRVRNFDVPSMFWMSAPLMVVALALLATGEGFVLGFAIFLLVLSMVISYLQLMTHFAALAHRPKILSDQMFAWGWLAPCTGLFVGVVIGTACNLAGATLVKSLVPIAAGVLVLAFILSLRAIERIKAKQEQDRQGEELTGSGGTAPGNAEQLLDERLEDMGLTARELQVAHLMLQGRSQRVISEQLFVAISTVNTHVKHIYQKAGVNSKQEFISLCEELSGESPHTE